MHKRHKGNCRKRRIILSIPLTEKILNFLLSKKQINGLTDVRVYLNNNSINIEGKINKFWLAVNFKVALVPIGNKDGQLLFKITELKPMNIQWVNNKLLHRRPIHAKNDLLIIDLANLTIPDFILKRIIGIKVSKKLVWCQFGI